jgi:hypothetical protein
VSPMVISTVFGLWPAISTASLFMPDPWRDCLLTGTSRREHPVSVGPAVRHASSVAAGNSTRNVEPFGLHAAHAAGPLATESMKRGDAGAAGAWIVALLTVGRIDP